MEKLNLNTIFEPNFELNDISSRSPLFGSLGDSNLTTSEIIRAQVNTLAQNNHLTASELYRAQIEITANNNILKSQIEIIRAQNDRLAKDIGLGYKINGQGSSIDESSGKQVFSYSQAFANSNTVNPSINSISKVNHENDTVFRTTNSNLLNENLSVTGNNLRSPNNINVEQLVQAMAAFAPPSAAETSWENAQASYKQVLLAVAH